MQETCNRIFARTYELSTEILASQQAVFDHLDDHERLAVHMTQSSAMMAGAHFSFTLDSAKGRAVGSRIVMTGTLLGLDMYVAEAVIERTPPSRKVWETEPNPRLLVIGNYRMGFEVTPDSVGALLRIFIEYDLPGIRLAKILAPLAYFYARWCVGCMIADARQHFSH